MEMKEEVVQFKTRRPQLLHLPSVIDSTYIQIHHAMPSNIAGLKQLSNALATPDQLSSSSSSIDGVPPDLETSIRFAGTQLTQAAGVLLRLSQDIIAQAIVTFTRFWIGAEGGSLRIYSVKVGAPQPVFGLAELTKDGWYVGRICSIPLPNRKTLLPADLAALCPECLHFPTIQRCVAALVHEPERRT